MAVISWTDEAGATKEHQIETDEFSIGRDTSNDLCLTAGSVSRTHATIRTEGDKYVIIDSSTNGTIVDGVLIQKGDEREIKTGSTIIIGDTSLRFAGTAEDEDAFHTQLMPAKAPPRIILLENGKPGKEFPFEKDEICIGSDAANDIVLTGTYVSRKHTTVIRDGDTFVLKDSSVNGTFVNSAKVTEKELTDGDVISVVDFELVFATGEFTGKPIPTATDQEKKRKIRIAILAASVELLVLIIVGLMASPKKKAPPTPGSDVTQTVETGMASVLKEADDLIAQERWDEALKKLETIGTTDSSYLAAQKKVQAIRQETRCLETKSEIERLITAEKFAEADSRLKGFPQDSKCAESLRAEFAVRVGHFCQDNLRRARENLDQDGPEQAKLLVDKCLAFMPENEDARQLAKVVQARLALASEVKEKADEKTRSNADATAAKERKNKELAQEIHEKALKAYLRGDISDAISGMNKIVGLKLPANDSTKRRAESAVKNLKEAKSRYDAGKFYHDDANTSKAYKEWNAFLGTNLKLDPDRESTLFRDVADKMTTTYCRFAKEKLKKGNRPDAFNWWSKAKEVDPADAEANKGLASLEKYARKKYREGYMLAGQGSTAGAKTCFKEVLQILPENHEYYIKSQKKLLEIDR